MLQNLFSNVRSHNRPITPLIHVLSATTVTQSTKVLPKRISGKRAVHTYQALRKDHHDKSEECDDKESQNETDGKKSNKPPWPPFGPSPSCCKPSSDQTLCPTPPRNPNPFYNSPQPCIKEPPPPWCNPPKEVPTFCQMPHLPPLPPISLMPDEKKKSSKKDLEERFDFDIFDKCDNILYKGDDDDAYYKELSEYFEPKYKNSVYHSFTKDSYANMAVCLSKFHAFRR